MHSCKIHTREINEWKMCSKNDVICFHAPKGGFHQMVFHFFYLRVFVHFQCICQCIKEFHPLKFLYALADTLSVYLPVHKGILMDEIPPGLENRLPLRKGREFRSVLLDLHGFPVSAPLSFPVLIFLCPRNKQMNLLLSGRS